MQIKSSYNFKFFLTFAFLVCVVVSLLYTAQVYAIDDKIDVTLKEPIVVTQGEELTSTKIFDSLYYGNIKLTDTIASYPRFVNFQLVISEHYENKVLVPLKKYSFWSPNSAQITYDTLFELSENQYVEGYLTINIFKTVTITETVQLPVIIKYNYKPEVKANHLYISESEFDNITTEQLYEKILKQVSIVDPEGRDDLTPKILGTPVFTAGKTTTVSVSVEDYNRSVTIPIYITIVANDVSSSTHGFENAKNRAISEQYYPYFRSDIMKNGDKYVAQKAEDGYLYFLNTDGSFLTTDGTTTGNKYPVDAGLPSIVEPSGSLYFVSPVSKWATDGYCISLLLSCFEDSDEFVQSWTFDENDIYVIKNQLINDTLDDNFYTNHYINGYCKEGSRKVNERTFKTEAQPLGYDGLQWYILDDTLYIEPQKISDESFTYKMPDFRPYSQQDIETILSENEKLLNQKDSIIIDSPLLFEIKNANTTKGNTPWANYSFSKVKIDNRVTHIGNYAFSGMTCIKEAVEIPTNCVSIGKGAFLNCVNMTGTLKTKYVSHIKPFAFANCIELEGDLLLGNNAITIIDDYAFYNCGFSNGLKLPSSLTTIGKYSFANCKNFNGNLIISANLVSIGKGAFMNCSGFDGNLTLNSNLTTIPTLCFANCYSFGGKLSLPDTLTTIEDYAFYNCTNLMGDLYLPDELVTIGVGSFKNCRSLKTTLTINKKLNIIGPEAFANCVNIVVIDNRNTSSTLKILPRAFFIDVGITRTQLLKNKADTVFASYPLLADGREVLNY